MTTEQLTAPLFQRLRDRTDGVWTTVFFILIALVIFAREQAQESLIFTGQSLLQIAPYLVLAVLAAAYAGASRADHLIGRVFQGNQSAMIFLAAAFGAVSPFCSCGVIPLIAALLSVSVPLGPVMAFWLASPIMDPSMFLLTAGQLGMDFAVAKTLAAFGLGIIGGFVTYALRNSAVLMNPLRDGVGNGGCGGARVRAPRPVLWKFWREPDRRGAFYADGWKNFLFLGKWLTLAFVIESLMLAYVPGDLIGRALGGGGIETIALGALLGVPAYLNGYAAVPLVSGLLEIGMAPGAAMAFLVAGGVTSIPAAMAVFALVKRGVFGLYLLYSLIGAFAAGLLFELWPA